MTDTIISLLDKLNKHIKLHMIDGIAIAFSGGVDSSLLLKAACDIGRLHNQPVLAVTFSTALHPAGDLNECKLLAARFGAVHRIITIDEFSDDTISQNPVDRCYHCKKLLFRTLIQIAGESGYSYCMDGSNYDDQFSYRPGMRALKELGIHSPLLELAITKEQIRGMADFLQIPCARKPSTPCLATRLPYNTPFDYALLRKIELGENYLKELGFYNIRLRLHQDIVRIEIDPPEFPKLLEHRVEIVDKLKKLGFLYLTLDLEGFRSGSMDIKHLESPL